MSEEYLSLLEWRRRVADMYSAVRATLPVDPPAAHGVCPQCGGPMRRGPQLTARQLAVLFAFGDTS